MVNNDKLSFWEKLIVVGVRTGIPAVAAVTAVYIFSSFFSSAIRDRSASMASVHVAKFASLGNCMSLARACMASWPCIWPIAYI